MKSDGFWADILDEEKFPFAIHQVTGYDQRCFVGANSLNEDITCYVEMAEGDINAQTVKLQYNVPPAMCEYVQFGAYWYWNFEPGFGPEAITVIKVMDAAGTVTSNTCLANGVPCGSPASEVSLAGTTCVYDLSLLGLPNCCFGAYSKTTTVITPTGADTLVQDGTWSSASDIGRCLSGPAVTDDEWPKTTLGTPVIKTYFTAKDGLNESLNIKAPIEVSGSAGNFHTANFFTDLRHAHSRSTPPPATSDVPYAVEPLADRSGTPFGFGGQASFEWRCLDRASEVKNRIRLYIRDWNTMEQFNAYRESGGGTADPDVEGVEGTDCEYELPLTGCNDHRDWDDVVDELQAVLGPDTGYDDASSLLRPGFFPQEPPRAGQ